MTVYTRTQIREAADLPRGSRFVSIDDARKLRGTLQRLYRAAAHDIPGSLAHPTMQAVERVLDDTLDLTFDDTEEEYLAS